MQLKYPKIFITGLPGVGKTTLVKRIIAELDPVQIKGFYTAEIRKRGVRQGFELCALNGDRQILSGVNVSRAFRTRAAANKFSTSRAGSAPFAGS